MYVSLSSCLIVCKNIRFNNQAKVKNMIELQFLNISSHLFNRPYFSFFCVRF